MSTNRNRGNCNLAPNPSAMPPTYVVTDAPAPPPLPIPGLTGAELMARPPSRKVIRLASFVNNRVGPVLNQWRPLNLVNAQPAGAVPVNMQQPAGAVPVNMQQPAGAVAGNEQHGLADAGGLNLR